jgi:hypothetical protein
MEDSCEPHHHSAPRPHHGPAKILGRIHRHSTHHIAAQLRPHPGACAAGGKLTLGGAVLKIAVPSAAIVALAAITPALIAGHRAGIAADPAGETAGAQGADPAALSGGGGAGGGIRISHGLGNGGDPRGRAHRAEPEPIAEPPTWSLLLLAAACGAGLRRWFRPV